MSIPLAIIVSLLLACGSGMCAVRVVGCVVACAVGCVGRAAPALGPLTVALGGVQYEDGEEKIVMDNCYCIRLSVWDEKVLLPQYIHVYTCNQATRYAKIIIITTVAILTFATVAIQTVAITTVFHIKAHLQWLTHSSFTPLHYNHSRSMAGRVIPHTRVDIRHLHSPLYQRLSQALRSCLVGVFRGLQPKLDFQLEGSVYVRVCACMCVYARVCACMCMY
jgi:hypothetical protein